jgi:hypothetical protein
MLAQAGASAPSARLDGELTSRFATDSVCYEFERVPGTFWLTPPAQPGVRPTIHGLALDASSASPTTCTLSPWKLDGTCEMCVAWNVAVPARAGLLMEARGLDERAAMWSHRSEIADTPWVVVGSRGSIPPNVLAPRAAANPRMAACEGWLRFETPAPYVQFRLRAFASDALSEPVLVERVCFAGSNRARASIRPYPPRGGCSLGTQLMLDADRAAHEEGHKPHPVSFVSLDARLVDASDADSLERASAVACLRMLFNDAPQVTDQIAQVPRVESRSLPSQLTSIAHECGACSRLECCSEHREAEGLLASGKPVALRTLDERNCLAWVVLSSFDEHDDALVYDPASYAAIPQHWTWTELERRWFGAGGLALALAL